MNDISSISIVKKYLMCLSFSVRKHFTNADAQSQNIFPILSTLESREGQVEKAVDWLLFMRKPGGLPIVLSCCSRSVSLDGRSWQPTANFLYVANKYEKKKKEKHF